MPKTDDIFFYASVVWSAMANAGDIFYIQIYLKTMFAAQRFGVN